MGKIFWKIIRLLLLTLLAALALLALYHRFALAFEQKHLTAPGKLVDVNGYKIHVYTEGSRAEGAPVAVLLSGSGTAAPVYDFKPLYSQLSDDCAIAVVEKAGYGYSDIADVPRDVRSMVEEVRAALSAAQVPPPYVLVPHSMSGLEALYWAQQFPEEVAGIVGLDMATPESYEKMDLDKTLSRMKLLRFTVQLGLVRLPGVYPLNTEGLTEAETAQLRMLSYRNALDLDMMRESQCVAENARAVKDGATPACPIRMFASDGGEIGDFWREEQAAFAERAGASLTFLDGGHYLHYENSGRLAAEIKDFLRELT